MKYFILVLSLCVTVTAWAGGKEKESPVVINETYITEVTERYSVELDCLENAADVATAQIHPTTQTNKMQLGFGFGYRCGKGGLAIGGAKLIKGGLVSGTVSYDDLTKGSVGVGLNIALD